MTGPSAPLADLVRTFEILRPQDDATRAAIARLLRIEAAAEAPPAPPVETTRHIRVEDQGEGRDEVESRPTPRRETPPAPAPVPEPAGDRAELSAVLKPDFTAPRRLPGWLEQVAPLPEETAGARPEVPVPDPLLEPRWTRALLSGALATFSETGPLDVPRLVRGVARSVPWTAVPRRPWPTLARGVQVLVDHGEAMLPFAADQDGLLESLRAVVGKERLEVLRFERPGDKAGAGPRRTWTSYFERHRPRPGMAVLALTDLGIGAQGMRPVRPADWRAFAEELRRLGAPLVALVPYDRTRWPEGLERVLTILPWDRSTSVRTVRRAIGRALALPAGPRT
jgi:hypothetical protein